MVEDNEINQSVILRQLGLLGYTADIANNGREALQAWRQLSYPLLLTDIHMPQMDGFELLRLLRGYREYDTMDIIVVTGMEASAIAKRGGLAPGVTVFPKPVPWQQLHGFVLAAISRKELVNTKSGM